MTYRPLRMLAVLFCLSMVLSVGVVGDTTYAHVFDHAGLFSAEELAELEAESVSLAGETGQPLFVTTTSDTKGQNTRSYAQDYYRLNELGKGSDYSGAMLCIDMDNREAYIVTSGSMIDILTDARIEALLDDVVGGLSQADYYAAATDFLQGAATNIAQGVPEGQYRQDEAGNQLTEPYAPVDTGIDWGSVALWGVISLAAGGGAAAFVAAAYKRDPAASYYPFREKSRVAMKQESDTLVNRFVTTRNIPKNPPPSSGGGGASTVRSSGGRSFGGGGRKF